MIARKKVIVRDKTRECKKEFVQSEREKGAGALPLRREKKKHCDYSQCFSLHKTFCDPEP